MRAIDETSHYCGIVEKFTNFLALSNGSLCELETYLYLAIDLEFAVPDKVKGAFALTDEVGRMTTALRKARS